MPFPVTPRVIYKKNPLERVICQLRFPPILKIDSETPSDFQEKIREKFPLYAITTAQRQEIAPTFNQGISPDMVQLLSKSSIINNHEFSSEDDIWHVNLTRTFISLSTTKYKNWEEFKEYLNPVIQSFFEIYKPVFFSRIGLRYVDVFNRTLLGIADTNWSKLIKPEFLGPLSTEIAGNIENFFTAYEIKLADDISKVRIASSFATHTSNNEQCFMVDSDFYTATKIKLEEREERLEFLHDRATRLIRWIITDELHDLLEPQKA